MEKLRKNEAGYSQLIPIALVIVIGFCLIFIGTYVNGQIHEELDAATDNVKAENTMNNITWNWDSTLDIVQVVIIISVLAAAIGAIFMFTRFR